MKVHHAALTDVGQIRKNNEDNFSATPEIGLFVVADGMGGHARGEVASKMTTDTVTDQIREAGKGRDRGDLIRAIQQANREVFAKSEESSEHRGMGTTVVGLLCLEGRVALAHVGDSRAYLFRRNQLKQLTRDHTLVQQQIDEGKLQPEEAENVPYKNVLNRAIGTQAEIQVDSQYVRVKENDTFLLCSDGLTGMLSDAQIAEHLKQADGDLEAACKAMIEAANQAGGKDNVTVVAVRFTDVHSPLEGIIDRLT